MSSITTSGNRAAAHTLTMRRPPSPAVPLEDDLRMAIAEQPRLSMTRWRRCARRDATVRLARRAALCRGGICLEGEKTSSRVRRQSPDTLRAMHGRRMDAAAPIPQPDLR